jgi:hypothetical protein
MNLDGKVGLDRTLVTHLASDPGPVRNVGETPDEVVAGEFCRRAGSLGLRRSAERHPEAESLRVGSARAFGSRPGPSYLLPLRSPGN